VRQRKLVEFSRETKSRLQATKPPAVPALPAKYSKLSSPERALVRERYAELQDGLCYYCKMPLAGDPPLDVLVLPIHWWLFPPNFLAHPVHLHHNHLTDMTIGTVHAYCNAVLFQYEGE